MDSTNSIALKVWEWECWAGVILTNSSHPRVPDLFVAVDGPDFLVPHDSRMFPQSWVEGLRAWQKVQSQFSDLLRRAVSFRPYNCHRRIAWFFWRHMLPRQKCYKLYGFLEYGALGGAMMLKNCQKNYRVLEESAVWSFWRISINAWDPLEEENSHPSSCAQAVVAGTEASIK